MIVMLATGVAEFGRAIYQFETLTKATRDAARYRLSVWLPTDRAMYPASQAQCLVVYGSTTRRRRRHRAGAGARR